MSSPMVSKVGQADFTPFFTGKKYAIHIFFDSFSIKKGDFGHQIAEKVM